MSSPQGLPQKSQLYHQLSRLYDPIFARVFGPRICETIRSLDVPAGAQVLEVGVGTGLSLSAYPSQAQVTGIDLSPTMLTHAEEKIDERGWKHVSLRQMDALNMEFEDESFDFVFAFHVVTVVPDPDRLIREMLRVCKSHGTIIIINHFRSERRWLASVMDLLDPVTRRLGWSTTLGLPELVEKTPLNVQQRFKTSTRSLFTVVTAKKASAKSEYAETDVSGDTRHTRPDGEPRRQRPAALVKRRRRRSRIFTSRR